MKEPEMAIVTHVFFSSFTPLVISSTRARSAVKNRLLRVYGFFFFFPQPSPIRVKTLLAYGDDAIVENID